MRKRIKMIKLLDVYNNLFWYGSNRGPCVIEQMATNRRRTDVKGRDVSHDTAWNKLFQRTRQTPAANSCQRLKTVSLYTPAAGCIVALLFCLSIQLLIRLPLRGNARAPYTFPLLKCCTAMVLLDIAYLTWSTFCAKIVELNSSSRRICTEKKNTEKIILLIQFIEEK